MLLKNFKKKIKKSSSSQGNNSTQPSSSNSSTISSGPWGPNQSNYLPYKNNTYAQSKAKNNNDIIKELKLYSGTQFNTEVATIMIELIKEGFIEKFSGERGKE